MALGKKKQAAINIDPETMERLTEKMNAAAVEMNAAAGRSIEAAKKAAQVITDMGKAMEKSRSVRSRGW